MEITKLFSLSGLFIHSAERFGTPQFLILDDQLHQRAKLIISIFQKNNLRTKIYYAYKANDVPHICEQLHQEGLGAEVSSSFELSLALHLGQKEIIFNGPGKTKEEIELAIKNSVIIIVDNFDELELVEMTASSLRMQALIGVRLNIPFLRNKAWSRFGIDPRLLAGFLKLTKKELLSFKGIHFHIGTEIESPHIYIKNLVFLKNILKKLSILDRESISFIDIGGGFGAGGYRKISFLEYKFGVKRPNICQIKNVDIDVFAKEIINVFKCNILSLKGLSNTELWLEPGRWLVDPTVHILTEALYVKNNFVIVDTNTIACYRLRNEIHPILNISNLSPRIMKQRLFGSLCRPDDLLGHCYFGNKARPNDIICLANVGAYSNVNRMRFSKPSPNIVSASGDKLKLIFKEESFDNAYQRFLENYK